MKNIIKIGKGPRDPWGGGQEASIGVLMVQQTPERRGGLELSPSSRRQNFLVPSRIYSLGFKDIPANLSHRSIRCPKGASAVCGVKALSV
eukprot:403069-Pelagomonas_calceolata.AAC.2